MKATMIAAAIDGVAAMFAEWEQAPAGEDLPIPMIPTCQGCGSTGGTSRRRPLKCPRCGGGVWFETWWSWRGSDQHGGVESGCASFTIRVDGTESYGLVVASDDGPFRRLRSRYVPVIVREILRLHEVEVQAIGALGRETVLGWSDPAEREA